ncbi:MAG: hypothetical protein HY096_00305 [Nitrospinae bacterium]|nr:hypothetical protein [Nitrospinota bacterium]
MASQLKDRRVVAAKIEVVEGVAETLSAADGGILAIGPTVSIDIESKERKSASASLSPYGNVSGKQSAKLSFTIEIKGAGAAYSASVKPALSPYFRACGFVEAIDVTVGLEKATYTPASTGIPSLTMACYEDGVVKKLRGCRGTVKVSSESGGVVKAAFEFSGVYDGVIDGAMLAPTYESTVPPTLLNTPLTFDAYTARAQSFEINIAAAVAVMDDITKAEGYAVGVITGRRPTGSLNPEMVTVATYDYYGKYKSAAYISLVIGKIGSTQYNRFKFTAPKMQITKVSDGDRNSVAVADLSVLFARNAGDDEIVLEFD